jgi:hypothetical protein
MMNEEEVTEPKTGLFFCAKNFPSLGGFSFSLGLAKEPEMYCFDGYDKPVTHEGYQLYLYLVLFNFQITFGFRKVKDVRGNNEPLQHQNR